MLSGRRLCKIPKVRRDEIIVRTVVAPHGTYKQTSPLRHSTPYGVTGPGVICIDQQVSRQAAKLPDVFDLSASDLSM